MTLYTATITLILVMDPLGNIPVFLSVLSRVPAAKRPWIVLREAFIAFLILTLFFFFGKYILVGMQISEPALGIAGGIILFLIAINMIFPHGEGNAHIKNMVDPFIVPLATPLVAGPSTMAMVMLFASQQPHHMWLMFLALFIAWFISTFILFFSVKLRKFFGERGLIAIERLMGMVLTTMAVQMFLTGIKQFFHLGS